MMGMDGGKMKKMGMSDKDLKLMKKTMHDHKKKMGMKEPGHGKHGGSWIE